MSWYNKFIRTTAGFVLAAVTAHGQSAQINKIGEEEFVSGDFMDRPSVATDSKAQPHFVCDAGGNASFMKYHKVNGKWAGGVFARGAKRSRYDASRLYVGQIEIDSKDRAWISCKFGCKEFGSMLGQGIWLFNNVANDITPPEQFFRGVNVYKGMGVVTTDAKYPDQGIVLGTHGNFNVLNSYGQIIKEGSINAGHGGEKVRARVGSYAPRFGAKDDKVSYPDGIWHTAMNGSRAISASYQNSTRYRNGQGPVVWADYGPYSIMGDDYHHPGIVADLSDPRVCYINTIFYDKMCINIWDGSKMLFNTSSLKVLDYGVTFEGRHAAAIAPAPGPSGGAFFFWTKQGAIKSCYVSKKGVAGKISTVAYGRSAAATTDRYGNIHLVYFNNGSRYRKLLVTTLDTLEPKGVVADTRTPAFRWTNTKAASYTIEITRDGAKLPLVPVSGTTTWTPSSDLLVGDYSWRVKEGGAFSSSQWSPAEPFVIPPVTPAIVSPVNQYLGAPITPNFAWTCEDDAVTRFTIQLFKGAEELATLNVSPKGPIAHDTDWTAPLNAGVYSWRARATRVMTGHSVSSPWSEPLDFQIGVPGTLQIITPEANDEFAPGSQTIGFTWSGAAEATAYKLKLLHNGAVFGEAIDNIAGTSQGFQGNFWPGYYSAWVTPKNSYGSGSPSAPVTFEVTRMMRPSNENTLDQAPGKLLWTRSKDATKYLTKLSEYNMKSRQFEVIRERWIDQTAWDVAPSWSPMYNFPNGTYRWSVTDYAGKNAHYTSVAYFQVKVPGRPALTEPTGAVSSHTVEFVWTDPSEKAVEFQIEVWKGTTKLRDSDFQPKADFLKEPGVYSRTYTFADTITGTLKWRVQSRNYKGVSPWREETFTLLP